VPTLFCAPSDKCVQCLQDRDCPAATPNCQARACRK
jgi:hypothetical protein